MSALSEEFKEGKQANPTSIPVTPGVGAPTGPTQVQTPTLTSAGPGGNPTGNPAQQGTYTGPTTGASGTTPATKFGETSNPTSTMANFATASRMAQREVGDHVLASLGLSCDKIDRMQEKCGIGTPVGTSTKIKDSTLKMLEQNNVINHGEMESIKDFQEWFKIESRIASLRTISDWKLEFDKDTLDDCDFNPSIGVNVNSQSNSVMTSGVNSGDSNMKIMDATTINNKEMEAKSKISVKVSEYPKWDGKQNTWKAFYINFQSNGISCRFESHPYDAQCGQG